MAKSEEKRIELIDAICNDITEGMSLRAALKKNNLASNIFYSWIDSDELKRKQYARACEDRADKIADEVLIISDSTEDDVIINPETKEPITNHNVIQRDRLRVDSRKWLLGKLNPKKYGDKLDVTSDGEKLESNPITFYIPDNKRDEKEVKTKGKK